MTQNYLTPEGEEKLKAELEELKGVKREELSARCKEPKTTTRTKTVTLPEIAQPTRPRCARPHL